MSMMSVLSSADMPVPTAEAQASTEFEVKLAAFEAHIQCNDKIEPIENDDRFTAQLDQIKSAWLDVVTAVLTQATLIIPAKTAPVIGGRRGQHTLHLAELLDDMQRVARTEAPTAIW